MSDTKRHLVWLANVLDSDETIDNSRARLRVKMHIYNFISVNALLSNNRYICLEILRAFGKILLSDKNTQRLIF